MANDLLDGLGQKSVKEFRKDFAQLIRAAFGMDKDYGKSESSLDKYMPAYKELIRLFNKKYKNLELKLKATSTGLKLQIFLKNEKKVTDVFSNAAARITGLKSIGANSFGAADVADASKFQKELEKISNKIYISYYHTESGSDTVYLEFNQKEKKIELHYDAGIADEKSPEFKLCAYYAVKDGYDEKIDVFSKGAVFGFTDLLSEDEKKDWLDKFNPRIEE